MDLIQSIGQALQPQTVDNIADQLGTDRATTQKAISAAVPLLVGALARNAKEPQGAESLTTALEKDHDGSLLGQLGALISGGRNASPATGLGIDKAITSAMGGLMSSGAGGVFGGLTGGGTSTTNGSGILGHILGGKRPAVEEGISRATGMDRGKVMQLLLMLAPIVMAAVGKMRREKGLGPDGVADMLRKEEEEVAQQTPGVSSKGLLDFLDTNKDGNVADDVARIGAALGGALLLGKMTNKI